MKDGERVMSKTVTVSEGVLQDESVSYTLIELSEISVIELSFLNKMIEEGVIEPKVTEPLPKFDFRALKRAEKASRLYNDLSINLEGVSLILDLLEKIQTLEQELALHKRE